MATAGLYLRSFENEGKFAGYMYWCPGCECAHGVWTAQRNERGAMWGFNGDFDRPTFSPSVLHDKSSPRCHCYVVAGAIQFLTDCGHALSGKTVPMEDWDSI